MKKFLLALMLVATSLSAKPVLISFDGSGWLDVWKDTLSFLKQENIHATYFVSAPYFVTTEEAKNNPYWAPSELNKKPLIELRTPSMTGTTERWADLNQAYADGHDICSHLCGK